MQNLPFVDLQWPKSLPVLITYPQKDGQAEWPGKILGQ